MSPVVIQQEREMLNLRDNVSGRGWILEGVLEKVHPRGVTGSRIVRICEEGSEP